jgi:hypothetical protein
MTAMSGNKGFVTPEKEEYLEGWTEMMVTIWRDKMNLHGVGTSATIRKKKKPLEVVHSSTGSLKESLRYEIAKQSGGDIAKISHFFNYYGMYLDGGVFPGRGSMGENYISNPNRKPKPWRDLSYGVSRKILRSKMLELTGKDFLFALQSVLLDSDKD